MRPDNEESVRRHKDTVYRIAFAQCGCREDADDVFQEVFLRLFSTGKEFESDEHLKAWLIRVTVNCCKLLRRSRKSRRETELTENVPDDGESDDSAAQAQAVTAAVKKLPGKYRPLVIMYYYEEMPCAEIARALKMNEATVRTRLRRARELLRRELCGIWNDE